MDEDLKIALIILLLILGVGLTITSIIGGSFYIANKNFSVLNMKCLENGGQYTYQSYPADNWVCNK